MHNKGKNKRIFFRKKSFEFIYFIFIFHELAAKGNVEIILVGLRLKGFVCSILLFFLKLYGRPNHLHH